MPMEMQTNATHQRRTFNLNEGKDWHDPFKFPTNDPSKDLFSRVISC
jgi:hypothetical protein